MGLEEFTIQNVRDFLGFKPSRWAREPPYLGKKLGEARKYYISDLCMMLPEPADLERARNDLRIARNAAYEYDLDLAARKLKGLGSGNLDAFVHEYVSVPKTNPQATSSIQKTPRGEMWRIRHGVLTPEMSERTWNMVLAGTKAVGPDFFAQAPERESLLYGFVNERNARALADALA